MTSDADKKTIVPGFVATLYDRVKVWERLSPAGKRWAMRLGVLALVLAVVVGVPAYLGLQPGLFAKYTALESQYDMWETSVHANFGCQRCHVEPGLISRGRNTVRMVGEFYASRFSTSREPDIFERPTNEACEDCHIDLRTVSPSGDLLIPHSAHVDILELECVHCHEFLVHELSPEGKHSPRMTMCLECHDGEQASAECLDCHTEKAVPDGHLADDWVVIHPDRQDEEDCASCHAWTEDWCADCHALRPQSHAGRWRSTHRDVVAERRNCEACHEAEHCIECHGEVPQLNFDPELTLVE